MTQPEWQQPLVSVDVVALRWDGEQLRFALHDRLNEPFSGRSALPGVLLLPGELLADAVHRSVTSKLGLDEAAIVHVGQVGAFDGTNRDPRGATISIAHLAIIGGGGAEHEGEGEGGGNAEGGGSGGGAERGSADTPGPARWVQTESGLPFDHDAIVAAAFAELGLRLWNDWALTRAILGEQFTTKSALALSHRLDALPNRASNIARWLEATGRVQRAGLSGRAAVWRWASPVQ